MGFVCSERCRSCHGHNGHYQVARRRASQLPGRRWICQGRTSFPCIQHYHWRFAKTNFVNFVKSNLLSGRQKRESNSRQCFRWHCQLCHNCQGHCQCLPPHEAQHSPSCPPRRYAPCPLLASDFHLLVFPGTNVTEAKKILADSGLPIRSAANLEEAAQKAVSSISS